MNPIRFLTMSIFFVITMIFPHQSSSIRINHPNPSDFHKGIPVGYDRMMRSSKTRRTYSSNDKFQIEFTCGIDDKVLCDKARKGFESAGQIITATISFKNSVIVNASFYDFCKTDNQCSDENSIVAGSANPTGTMVLTGDDGIKRHYPQALVKQLPFEESPEFGPSDITAKFNSKADFWFEGNESPIKPEQADFQLVVLHELIHGLGFYSSWNDFFDFANPQGLTPVPSVEASSNETSGMIFNGFVENIFDKHLIFLSSGERTSNVTAELNTIVTGDPYQKQEDFIMAFKSSSQYQLSRRMLKVATTLLSLGFLPKNANDPSEAIVLETSLNPYQTGSSLGHVDFQTYANTSDFLMTYRQDSGMTLGDYVSIGGNYAGGPIGPKLRQVLETMGYDIKESYDSPNILSVTQKDHKDHNEAAPSTISNIVFVIFIGIMDIFLMSHI